MIQHIRSFWFVLGSSRHQVLKIIFLFVMTSFMDVVGVGLIGPYIAAMLDPSRLAHYPMALSILSKFGYVLGVAPLMALGLVLIVLFIVKGLVSYRIQRKVLHFAFTFRTRIIERLMIAFLHMPFAFYLSRSSASLVQSITSNTKQLTDNLLIPSLRFVSDSIVLCLICALLFWVNPLVMMSLAFVIGITFFIYLKLVRPRLRQAGEMVAIAYEGVITSVAQGVQGIKEIRVLGAEQSILEDIRRSARQSSLAETSFNSMLMMPRYLMETIVVIFILSMTIISTSLSAKPAALFSLLAMFAAAGLRALPAMVQIGSSLASMNYSAFALRAVYRDLREVEGLYRFGSIMNAGVSAGEAVSKFKKISLINISFSYPDTSRFAIDGVSIEILRGTTVGLIGESGSGKTTLVDILIGLHPPTVGHVAIDTVDLQDFGIGSWMKCIAYIPQAPFIADDTVTRNIAMGIELEKIDFVRLDQCIHMARLSNVVANLSDGIDTVLGGHGSRLSGGERQRIALARALYHDRDILVFDEATSALDVDTEREIVKTIEGLRGSKTIIIIAHRFSTLSGCDVIYKLNGGKVVSAGTLSELI